MKLTAKKINSLIAIFCMLLAALALTLKYFNWDFDDSFIIYRYARNIIDGNGWCYNPGECYNASTSTLNTFLIACVAFINKDPRATAHILGGLYIAASGVFVYLLLRKRLGEFFSASSGLLVVVSLGENFTWGIETNLFIALIFLFILLEDRGRNSWWPIGLLILARPDGALFLFFKIVYSFFKDKRLPWQGIVQAVVPVFPWFAYSLYHFHHLLPATLGQKVWQGSSGFWGDGNVYMAYLLEFISSFHWWEALFAALGVIIIIKERSFLLYLLIFTVIQQLVYIFLNVPGYHWYAAVFSVALKLSFIYGLGWLITSFLLKITQVNKVVWKKSANLAATVLLLAFSAAFFYKPSHPVEPESRTVAYKRLAEKLQWNIPGGRLAALEVGVVGYYTKWNILDIIGLTTPWGEFATGRNNDRFFELRPEAVVIHSLVSTRERAIFTDPRFSRDYRLGCVINTPGYQDIYLYILKV